MTTQNTRPVPGAVFRLDLGYRHAPHPVSRIQIAAIFGEISLSNPLVILAVYSPGFAGVFLVWRHYGLEGLGSFFKRLTLWRAPVGWWLFLILGIPAVVYTGAAIKGSLSDPFPFSLGPRCCQR